MTPPASEPGSSWPGPTRALGRAWHSLRAEGWRATVRKTLENLALIAGPDAPRRLRERYLRRDALRFDRRHGTDTAGLIDWGKLERGRYEPTDEESFVAIVESLALPLHEFTFVDIGCGKGKSTLLAARYPFRAVIGMEYDAELAATAERNLAGWRTACGRVEVECGDATTFDFPTGALLLYLFNPFGGETLGRFLAHVEATAASEPVAVVYYHTVHADVLERCSWLQPLGAERPLLHGGYRTWVNRPLLDRYPGARRVHGASPDAS